MTVTLCVLSENFFLNFENQGVKIAKTGFLDYKIRNLFYQKSVSLKTQLALRCNFPENLKSIGTSNPEIIRRKVANPRICYFEKNGFKVIYCCKREKKSLKSGIFCRFQFKLMHYLNFHVKKE